MLNGFEYKHIDPVVNINIQVKVKNGGETVPSEI